MWFKKCGFYAYGINVQNCDVRRCHQQILHETCNHMPGFKLQPKIQSINEFLRYISTCPVILTKSKLEVKYNPNVASNEITIFLKIELDAKSEKLALELSITFLIPKYASKNAATVM